MGAQRLFEAKKIVQRIAAVLVCRGKIRPQSDRSVVAGERLSETLEHMRRVGPIGMPSA